MKTRELKVKKNKGANIAAWILQVLLAAMFIMAGAMKLFTPIDELAASLAWATDVPAILLRFIGLAEILGGLGLIIPGLLRMETKLVPLAAMGIVLIMVFAAVFHLIRGEASAIGMNIIIGILAGLVAWLRLKKAPLQERTV